MRTAPLVRILLAITAATALTATAHADSGTARARREVRAADIDYRLGRFGPALAGYTRAYELYPVPELLFNIAQCHKNLKDYDKAIFFFEGYLRDAPNAANRALVEDLLRELKALASPAPAPLPIAPAEPAPAAPVSVPLVPPPGVAHAEPAPLDAPRATWLVPGALVVGGLAAAAGGGAFYYYGQKRGAGEKYVYDDTRLVGGALIAVGGAAVATGIVVWLRRPSSSPVAAITAGGGYLGWAGVF